MPLATGWRLELTDPAWLWGLAVLPLLAWWAFRTLVHASGSQRLVSLLCRAAVVTALVLAMAGLTLRWPTNVPFVVFAVDRSLSVGDEGTAAADSYIDRAMAGPHGGPVGFLGFGASPGPVAPDRASALAAVSGGEARKGTDIAAAIGAAAGAVPQGFVPRIVLLTDGNATSGDALAAARQAAVPIWTVPLATPSAPEVQVSEVVVPAQVREGEPFHVKVVINSNHDDQGFLEVYDNNLRIPLPGNARVKVHKGENSIAFTYRPTDQQFVRVKAGVRGFQDGRAEDNWARGLVRCIGRPRVLIVDSDTRGAEHLVDALTQEGIQVDPPRPPEGLPDTLAELQNFDLVILSNVPATHPKLTQRHFQQLRTYVQDLGGGLLLIGGDRSFGPGGYARSPIEDLLPVYCDFRKEQEKPSLAMVFVLDKSGSMAGQKIELVKEASRAAVELLGPKDRVGIVAFDSRPHWASQIRAGSEKGQVLDGLSRIDAEGGTSILPGMKMAAVALGALGPSARYKHMIVLSDGADNEKSADEFFPLLQLMVAARITVSCVAVGGDADLKFLEQVARRGGGRFYAPDDVQSVPQIFAQETIQASKDALVEEPFAPMHFRGTPVLDGINFEEAPDLNGYVLTRIKPTSEQILMTHRGDPLLAWWRTGLGMCGAFTSDAQARWSEPWISNWPGGFTKFWAQVTRHLMRKQDAAGIELQVRRSGGRASVTLDATDPEGAFLNEVSTVLTVVGPQKTEQKSSMPQTAPGRYEAGFDTLLEGDYWMIIVQNPPDRPPIQLTHGLAVGYPDELRLRPVDQPMLEALASATGGRFDPAPSTVLVPSELTVPRDRALWPYVLVAAAVLFVADVALRRIQFTRLATSVRRFSGSLATSRHIYFQRRAVFRSSAQRVMAARARTPGHEGYEDA
jgi:Ca-activated chloride channel family protein